MRSSSLPNSLHVAPQHQPVFRELGIDLENLFTSTLIKPWRVLPSDRDNSVLDATLSSGTQIRWHVKRYVTSSPAMLERDGHDLLATNQIPTAPLIAWGVHRDGRSATISEDLADHEAADKLIASSSLFDPILDSTADLAAKLHNAQLHHRDLYLCHFFINKKDPQDVKLIDVARVASFANSLLKRRWIVKDLSQFWYSTLALPITDDQRLAWLDRYASQRKIEAKSLLASVKRKSDWIARHDRKLKQSQPTRNVSIPST